MDKTKSFRDALRYATDCSVELIAREAGRSRSLFDRYLNRQDPSAESLRRLASVLRRRADRLREHADALEAAADEAER